MSFKLLMQVAGILLIPILAVLIPIVIGHRYGVYQSKKSADLQHAPVGSVVGAAFALLAFMLAFTFQITSNRYDVRKTLLLDEVTNIRTTYLRAGLIPEPYGSSTQELLVEYVEQRTLHSKNAITLDASLARSQEILDVLWSFADTLAVQDRSSEVYALYTTSVNDLVDNFNQRISMTFQFRIPSSVLMALLIITVFSMLALGYQFGISGKGNIQVSLLLAIIFSVVIFLIIALDRPELGLAKISHEPFFHLLEQLRAKQ